MLLTYMSLDYVYMYIYIYIYIYVCMRMIAAPLS